MPAKCHRCGVESIVEEAFCKIKQSESNRVAFYCPACWKKHLISSNKQWLLAIVTTGIVGGIFVAADSSIGFGWLLLNLFFLQVFIFLGTVLHELGHGFAARVLNLRLFRIEIGFGRMLYEFRIGSVQFQFNSIPFGGVTFGTHRTEKWYRIKQFVFVLAGPLTNILLGIVALFVLRGNDGTLFPDFTVEIQWLAVFFLANCFLVIISLIPFHSNSANGKLPNDGMLLWQTLFVKHGKIEDNLVFTFILEAELLRKKKDYANAQILFEKAMATFPQNLHAATYLGMNLLDLKRYQEAREYFLKAMHLPPSSSQPQMRYILLNNIAYANALVGDPALLNEAEEYSAEALQQLSWVPAIKGTRGTVLIQTGKVDEGLKLLLEAMEAQEEPHGKALNACHAAIGEIRKGDMTAAKKYYDVARSLDAKCILLESVENEGRFN